MSRTNVFKIIYAEASYTGVSRIVSDKKQWVEQTLESLESSFDKKALLEQAERFEDPELRSIITTSLTGSMAKRKLEQYRARMDPKDAPGPEPKPSDKDAEDAAQAEDPKDDATADPNKPTDSRSLKPSEQDDSESNGPLKPEPIAAPEADAEPKAVDFTKEPEPIAHAKKPPTSTKRAPDPKPQATETAQTPPSDTTSVDASEPIDEAPPEPTRDAAKDMPDSRFDALEETILSSKSNKDLSVPDLPDGMLDSIRQLKNLARSKVREKPKEKHRIVTAEPANVKSDELLEALDGLAPTSGEQAMQQTPAADTPAFEEPPASHRGDRSDEVAELFDEFLEHDSKSEASTPAAPVGSTPEPKSAPSSEPTSSAAEPLFPPARSEEPAGPTVSETSSAPVSSAAPARTASAEPESAPVESTPKPERAPSAQPAEPEAPVATGAKAEPMPEEPPEEPTDHGMKPLAPTRSGSGEQAAVEQKSESDSTADLEAFDAFLESPDAPVGTTRESEGSEPSVPTPSAEATEPEQPAEPKKPIVPTSVEEISKRFQALLGSMTDMNREIPHPEQYASPEKVPSSEPLREEAPQTAEQYDGSWIESCESIGDVIDVLDSVEGSIEDVRNTVALFVLPVSDDLASTIRTAQNRDELELMLRRALTVTIDDAFERTKARFEKEQQAFEHEAFEAAETFDEAVSKATRTHEQAVQPAQTHEQPPEPTHDDAAEPIGDDDVRDTIEDVYEAVEQESADDLSQPVGHHTKPEKTITERVHDLIARIHREVEQGSYDAAVAHVGEARELISRQIKIKKSRGDPTVDETMADYELKALVLDLEILQTRNDSV